MVIQGTVGERTSIRARSAGGIADFIKSEPGVRDSEAGIGAASRHQMQLDRELIRSELARATALQRPPTCTFDLS